MLFASCEAAEAELGSDWCWPNFQIPELACRCAGRFCDGAYWHAPAFLDRLQGLRDAVARPLVLTSAHRCPQWNACVGGAPLSFHKTLAADIWLEGHDRFALLEQARDAGFTGLGLARQFLHLDRRAIPAIWTYQGSKSLWQR